MHFYFHNQYNIKTEIFLEGIMFIIIIIITTEIVYSA
jgi:hypothetical protein